MVALHNSAGAAMPDFPLRESYPSSPATPLNEAPFCRRFRFAASKAYSCPWTAGFMHGARKTLLVRLFSGSLWLSHKSSPWSASTPSSSS